MEVFEEKRSFDVLGCLVDTNGKLVILDVLNSLQSLKFSLDPTFIQQWSWMEMVLTPEESQKATTKVVNDSSISISQGSGKL